MTHEDHNSMKDRRRRRMTEAEKRKRHEIAEAIHREHPDMPMAKKMRIATSAAMGRRRR